MNIIVSLSVQAEGNDTNILKFSFRRSPEYKQGKTVHGRTAPAPVDVCLPDAGAHLLARTVCPRLVFGDKGGVGRGYERILHQCAQFAGAHTARDCRIVRTDQGDRAGVAAVISCLLYTSPSPRDA